MASPISTGGAGIHLESRVAAYYLASVLTGGAVRGLPRGVAARQVELQRAALGQPLDDVIVHGQSSGGPSTLSLQVKRTLAFGDNELFKEVMAECWKTFKGADFREGVDRFGVAVGTPDLGVEKAGRNVFAWARESANAADFLTRMGIENFASAGMRDILAQLRGALDTAKGQTVTDQELWLFVRHLVVLYFDLDATDQSHSLVELTDRLRFALPAEDSPRAGDLWLALVDIADSAKPAAGSLDRPTLIAHLQPAFNLATARSIQSDLDVLHDIARRSLDDIRTDIGGVHLPRTTLRKPLEDMVGRGSMIEIVGEAGTGKSALAKTLLLVRLEEGPALVLTSKRLPAGAPGWEGLARHWGLRIPLDELIAELSCIATPCLLVDGVDRIEDAGAWLAVNDVLRAVRRSASASRWTIILTARTNSLDYRTRLDPAVMPSPPERMQVTDLGDDDIAAVTAAHPAIAPLVAKNGPARELAARPYLLSRLVRGGSAGIPESGPVTEIDLMLHLWEGVGPGGDLSEAQILARQDTLVELGRRRLTSPSKPLTSIGLSPEALVSLRKDDILDHDRATRAVVFSHDMVEDWVLCQALNHVDGPLADAIEQAGQPLWLVDAVQLLAQWRIERSTFADQWGQLLDEVSREPLEPRWRRAVLTAPLQSTKGMELLLRIEERLWQQEGQLLADLMVAMRTVEVEPNLVYLNETRVPGLDYATRIYAAHEFALPRARSWLPFLYWLVANLQNLPPQLIDGASEVLAAVARAYETIPKLHAPAVAAWARQWLDYINPQGGDWNETYNMRSERLSTLRLQDKDKFEERLRVILCRCAAGAPEEVVSYLHSISDRDRADTHFVIEHANWLVEILPGELVDFLLEVMCDEDPPNFGYGSRICDFNELGIRDDRLFFQASHLRPPFLRLLQQHTDQGIRLINGLCAHAMARWRAILREERSGTPLPVRIQFAWGQKEFWGHYREYTWNRGMGPGPYTVMSGLMALEVWIEQQIVAGHDAEEVFRRALEGNDCVGALGACVAVSLAFPEKCLRAALPLAANLQLCHWDIRRAIQDGTGHVIALPKDRVFLKDVIERSRQSHRRDNLRDSIIPRLMFTTEETRRDFIEHMERLKADPNLPYEFEERKADPAWEHELREQVRRLTALAELDNWNASFADETSRQVAIQYTPPADVAPDPEFMREQAERERATGIALWAEQMIKDGQSKRDVSQAHAFTVATEIDEPHLFEYRRDPSDICTSAKIGAVSGAAAMLVKFAAVESQEFIWAREALVRAATSPLDTGPFIFEDSAVMFHPTVNAAAGLVFLVERQLASDEERELLLWLACHPLLAVKRTIATMLARCWKQDALLCWQVLVLCTKLSLRPWSILYGRQEQGGLIPTRVEGRWILKALIPVVRDYRNGRPSNLPRIPLPWEPKPQDGEGYRRSDMAFLWHVAPEIVFPLVNGAAMADPDRHQKLLPLIADFMSWTAMDVAPPVRNADAGYEWAPKFMEWSAKLTCCLSEEEVRRLILAPVADLATRADRGPDLLRDLILHVIFHRVRADDPPAEEVVRLWSLLLEIVLNHPEAAAQAGEKRAIYSGYGECISLMIFTYQGALFDHPWPALTAFRTAIDAWVQTFVNSPVYYRQLVVFLQGGGYGLAPDPALTWLSQVIEAHRSDREFWVGTGNGEQTGQLLARVLDDHQATIRASQPLLRQMIRMSDILVSFGVRIAAQVQQRLAALQ